MAIFIGGNLGEVFRGDIRGVPENDLFYGNNGSESIAARAGSDTIFGGRDNDTLLGEQGNDVIDGGQGADSLSGAGGVDTLSYATAPGGVTVNLGSGEASGSHATGDTISGFENVIGTGFNDILIGNGADNEIVGGGGRDLLVGGGGHDTLLGGFGGDTLSGGSGRDMFVYQQLAGSQDVLGAIDTILDFRSAIDVIDLRGIDADLGTPDTDDDFTFIGTDPFTGAAGELRLTLLPGGGAQLEGDSTGGGVANLSIVLLGAALVTESDLLL